MELIKYKNRKIYNRSTKKYVNLKEIGQLATAHRIIVKQHDTGKDITRDTVVKALLGNHIDKISATEYL